MRLKDRVLSLLMDQQSHYLSGEEIASALGVSRNGVWKAVQQLQRDGYSIEGVRNRGYLLTSGTDLLSAPGITRHLCCRELTLDCRTSVTTTMEVGRQAAEAGAAEGYVVIAEQQTAGKGRMGRSFYSPAGSGIYLSILLRPTLSAEQSLLITTCAAVACAQAIEAISGQDAQIKWVNDIYQNGKKVCGILTEASIDVESGGPRYAVLGIGINLLPPAGGFPADIADKAGTLLNDGPGGDLRCRTAAAVLNRFFAWYPHLTEKTFLPEYRRRSMLTGQAVDVLRGDTARAAVVQGIDDDFALIVAYDDGSTARLSSGEVSIRKK